MTGYLFKGKLSEENLKQLIKNFFDGEEVFNIPEDIDYYRPEKGIPTDLKLNGRVFSEKGEIRWAMKGKEYSVFLLTEKEVKDISGLTKSKDTYEVKKPDNHFILVSLKEAYISPSFSKYPNNSKNGYLEACIYLKNNIPLTIRLRRFR